jgi:hypothetical protein
MGPIPWPAQGRPDTSAGARRRVSTFPALRVPAFTRLRVLSREAAGAGATMKPRSAERSCQFAQPAEGGGETAEQHGNGWT